jgi:hypothetical protein
MRLYTNAFVAFWVFVLTAISIVVWLGDSPESAILSFCICMILMVIHLKASDLEIEILRMHRRLLKHKISMTSEPFATKDEVDQEVE